MTTAGDLPAPPRVDRATVLLAGDVMTGRGIDQVMMHPGAPELHESYVVDARDYVRLAEAANGPIDAPVPPEYVWGDALERIRRAAPALRIVNLETAITRRGGPWPSKGIHYRMNPDNVDCLRVARIDACALANNHMMDWGRDGLAETLHTLREAGLRHAGAGVDRDEAWAPARLDLLPHGRLLLFACATPCSGIPAGWAAGTHRAGVAVIPEPSAATASRVAREVARWRRAGDVVVVSIHWGGNWGLDVPPAHREFARRLLDLEAADIVHGHSSHHALPLEVYRERLILYGCGDLINDYEGIGAHGGLRSDVGCLYFATLDAGSGRLHALEIVPFQMKRFRLVEADPSAHEWLARVYRSADADLGMQPRRNGRDVWLLVPTGAAISART